MLENLEKELASYFLLPVWGRNNTTLCKLLIWTGKVKENHFQEIGKILEFFQSRNVGTPGDCNHNLFWREYTSGKSIDVLIIIY